MQLHDAHRQSATPSFMRRIGSYFTPHRHAILIAFGLLDALLLGRFVRQAANPIHFLMNALPIEIVVVECVRSFLLISLAFTAVGLIWGKQWALWLSYVQFPFRLLFMLLTFGFLGLLARIPDFPVTHFSLMLTAMGLECVRLTVTLLLHGKPNRKP